MNDPTPASSNRWLLIGLAVLIAFAAALAGWFTARLSGPGSDRAAIESIVRNYLLENPEILPEAMDNLQRKNASKQLASIRQEVMTPYPGAVLGNPKGKVTIVEFSDFACGFCRRSVADIGALIADNPELRIVVRELPILSDDSAQAARMALAAARQGRYDAFYHALFAAGRPDARNIEAAARKAGVDLDQARTALADPAIDAAITRNVEMARQLGFGGTPSWVIGDQLISGAVGVAELSTAIEELGR